MIIDPISLAGVVLTAIPLVYGVYRWYRERREKCERFMENIGITFTSEELRRKPLSPETRMKAVRLIKCRPDEWNEEFLWTKRADKVKNTLQREGEALVIGESGLGKTRTVLEVLRSISREKEILVVVPRRDVAYVEVPSWCLKGYDLVVLFFDDINTYLSIPISHLVYKVKKTAKKVWVVATCRSEVYPDIEDEPTVKSLFVRKSLVRLKLYSEEEGRKIARLNGKEFKREEFRGTGADVILGSYRKAEVYRKLKECEKQVLRAVKLLKLAGVSVPKIRHVKLVWTEILGSRADWHACFKHVLEMGFLVPWPPDKPEIVEMPDAYLAAITDYPSYPGEDTEHLEKLTTIMERERAHLELLSIGVSAGLKGLHETALKCFNSALRIKPDFAEAYYNRGVARYELGDYEGALSDFGVAWSLRDKLPDRGIRIPSSALKVILRCLDRVPSDVVSAWVSRAREVRPYLSEERRKALDELLEKLGQR